MNGRTQLVDLVPRSNLAFVGVFGGGMLVVAALEACYAVMPLLNPHTTDGRVATFDLDAEGSLAVWVSSFTLLAAAGACLLTLVLRAESGRSRGVWLWAALCWTVMSIDECSSLHEAFKELMSHATGERLWHDGTLWWVLAYLLVLSATGMRLLWEMRACRGACLVFLAAAGFYAVAALAELGWITAKDVRGVMLEEGCEMLGNFSLLTAMLLYTRHTADQLRKSVPHIMTARFTIESATARRTLAEHSAESAELLGT